MKLSRLLLGAMVALLGIGSVEAAMARCSDYQSPVVLSKQEFLATAFGSLGVRYARNRWLLVTGARCYDLSRYKIYAASFDIKSTGEPQAAYFAAAVTRTFSAANGEATQHSLELFRNASKPDRADKWLRVTDSEAQMEAGTQLNGSEYSVLRAGFDSGILPSPFEPQTTDLTVLPVGGRWHAVLSLLSGPRSPDVNIPVLANSRVGINSLTAHLAALVNEQGGPVFTKIYLNKFLTSPAPSLGEAILEPGGGASCMYVTHGIGGLQDISINDTLNTTVLKFGAEDC